MQTKSLPQNLLFDLTGLERQKKYLEQLNTTEGGEYTLFIPDKVVESMRDSGYRDIRKALNDIIDNSIEANATHIDVIYTSEKPATKNSKTIVSNIGILDDGHGMYPEMIMQSVAWGGSDRHNSRKGLGRFGFGLPTAAVSITRHYEVYSKVKDGEWHKVKINLDEISKMSLKGLKFRPEVEKTILPLAVKKHLKECFKVDDLEQGTLVWLINPDRIRSFAVPQVFEQKMLQNIGVVFRNYFSKHQFYVGCKQCQLIDPKFLNSESMYYDIANKLFAVSDQDPFILSVKTTDKEGKEVQGNIEIKMSWMDPKFQRNSDGTMHKGRFNVMKENNQNYFLVSRAGRQIDQVINPNYQNELHNITIVNYDRNWVVELDFEPVLDELFGITTNKQQVEIDEKLWDLFDQKGLPKMIEGLRSQSSKARAAYEEKKKGGKDEIKASEEIIKSMEVLKPTELSEKRKEKNEEVALVKAEVEAKETGKSIEEVIEEKKDETKKYPWRIIKEYREGAPLYMVNMYFNQTQIIINTWHRFYEDIYSKLDSKGQNALDLFFYVLSKSELESQGAFEQFYGIERNKWSSLLQVVLGELDKKDPSLYESAMNEDRKERQEMATV